MKKSIWIVSVILLLGIGFLLLIKNPQSTISQKVLPLIALDPASLYCKQVGGIHEVQEGTGRQINICRFPTGSSCEEWAFFRGDCPILPQQGTVDDFKLNILSLLPSNLAIEVEKLFSSFDTITGDFQQDQRKTILQEVINFIRKNVAPTEQKVNNNQIDPIDMEEIIMPNICNIMNFYNIISEECTTTGTELTGMIETSGGLMDQANLEIANQQISSSTEKYTAKAEQGDNIPGENINVYDKNGNQIFSLLASNAPDLQHFDKIVGKNLIVDYGTSFDRTLAIYDVATQAKIFESSYHSDGNELLIDQNGVTFNYTLNKKPQNAPTCSSDYNGYTETRIFDLNTKELKKTGEIKCAFFE